MFLTPFTFDFTTIDLKAFLAALAILVTLVIAFYSLWWRNRRRFSYEVISNNLLISDEAEIKDKLEIRFANQPVKDVRLIVVKFVNDGSQPIKKDDFQGRIKLSFPKAKILSAEKVKSSPENLGVELSHDNEAVRLTPVLFNRKDYIQFKVLVSKYEGMKIDARIVGVSQIQKARSLSENPRPFILAVSALLTGSSVNLILQYSSLSLFSAVLAAIGLFVVISLMLVAISSMFSKREPM